jgi:hypothetical protein
MEGSLDALFDGQLAFVVGQVGAHESRTARVALDASLHHQGVLCEDRLKDVDAQFGHSVDPLGPSFLHIIPIHHSLLELLHQLYHFLLADFLLLPALFELRVVDAAMGHLAGHASQCDDLALFCQKGKHFFSKFDGSIEILNMVMDTVLKVHSVLFWSN